MTIFRRFAMIVAALGLTAVAACNTVEGVGKDVSAGGKAITGAADSTQKKLP